MKGSFIAKRRVKLFLKQNQLRTGREVYEALDAVVTELLLKAIKRANGNRRDTLMVWDL